MTVRILDLGAHDGYVAAGLLSEFPDALIDGVELNEQAAAIANTRLTGTCMVGPAEDAPGLFEPGTYDVVTLFEIIEHVHDVPELLDAAERMVKPGGRVYVSTPDGHFGQGGNPLHLRAYRAVDLADLLRRRGRLRDMLVGPDGVTVASYTPGPRREDIAIYAGAGWEPWHPSDIRMRGLGGSETAACRLAEALSDLGFIVTVYGELREDSCWRDVIFRHHTKFDPLEPRGAVISSRIPHLFDRPVAARTRLLWVHDVDCGDTLTPRRAERIDHVLALSKWHMAHLAGRYPFIAGKLVQTRNGIDHSLFTPQPWAKREPRVLYTSSPDRGLDVLLELWPRVRERVPDAELHHCYAAVYDRVADQDPEIGAHREKIRELSGQPGVVKLGALSQPNLAALMCDSRVWCHPSWVGMQSIAFQETSCIGAMEAQAAGCVVVASDWGALSETVRWGFRVNGGDPTMERWRTAFVEQIVRGLTDQHTGDTAVRRAPDAVKDLGWEGVAVQIGQLVAAGDR